jgi:hypothetical protein
MSDELQDLRPAIHERAVETCIIVSLLEKGPEIVTYDEMRAAGVANPQSLNRHNLKSARDIVQNERELVYATIPGYGVKLVTADGYATLGQHAIAKTYRHARRTVKKLLTAKPDEMSPAGKLGFNTSLACMGVVQLFTQRKTVAKITRAQEQSAALLGLSETIALCGK